MTQSHDRLSSPQAFLDGSSVADQSGSGVVSAEYYPGCRVDELLLGTVRRCDFFASDATDEFRVQRETGEEQGIFKVWAAPVIPVLETGILDVDTAGEVWSEKNRNNPLGLFESLEHWRSFSAVADRRLEGVFKAREVPDNPQDAMAELMLRLDTAFAYAAPFYNLEALVADTRRERPDNPIDFGVGAEEGGRLDAVAMLLPAALKNHVVTERLLWNGLDWDSLSERIEAMRADFTRGADTLAARQFSLISKIAQRTNQDPEDVLFSANVLEFIPADVGGKCDDMPQDEAIGALQAVLDGPVHTPTTGSVARDANALIRFLNWSPANKSRDNFAGKSWSYAAVCDTAAELVGLITAHPDLAFSDDFAGVFNTQLAPQLEGLDAASAKGRFMLQLFSEGHMRDELIDRIAANSASFKADVQAQLEAVRASEQLVPIGPAHDALLVGGKAIGLRRATQLFGKEKVVGGQVITTEAIGDWLSGIESAGTLLRSLTNEAATVDKVLTGQAMIGRIWESEVPPELIRKLQAAFPVGNRLVLRSSSFDEDIDIIGPAPGIYESAVDIDSQDPEAIAEALRFVVASFFSEKAISFRDLKGLNHTPLFAVLAQEFQAGPGGSLFIQGGRVTMNIALSPSDINEAAVAELVEEHRIDPTLDLDLVDSALISSGHIRELVHMARLAESVGGQCDIEFVVSPNDGRLQLLQLRSLERPTDSAADARVVVPDTFLAITNSGELPDMADGDDAIGLRIGEAVDLDQFQGSLLRWITSNRDRITMITLGRPVPTTCHFANVMHSLNITVRQAEAA